MGNLQEELGNRLAADKVEVAPLNARIDALTGKENEVIIQQHKNGAFITDYETLKMELIGLPFKIKQVEIDNVVVDLNSIGFDPEQNSFIAPKNFTELHIVGE